MTWFAGVEDVVGGFGPGEGLAAVVVAVDEAADGGGEVFDAGEAAAADGWRVMMPKKISTMFSHDPLVGVKCRVIRGLRCSQAPTVGCLWVP